MLTCLCRVRDMWTSKEITSRVRDMWTASKVQLRKGGSPIPLPVWKSGILPEDVGFRRHCQGNGLAGAPVEEPHSVFPAASSWCHWRGDSTSAAQELPEDALSCWKRRELTQDPDLPAWIALLCSSSPNSSVPNESQLLGRAWNQPQTPALKLSRTHRWQHCSEIPP